MVLGFRRFIVAAFSVIFLLGCQPDGGSSPGNKNSKGEGTPDVTEPPGPTKNPEPHVTVKLDTVNSKAHLSKPIVIMISIDGFRADYLQKYQPPTLLSWAREGVQSEGLIPSFPTLTFPNHITLVTGLRPGHHGIVGNTFYDEKRKAYYTMSDNDAVNDGSWYRGEPIWTVAEKNGMLAGTFFWVGSESKIGGIDPTYMAQYNGKVTNSRRIQSVIEWLKLPEARRPHFIGLYFSDVDSSGHVYGPDAPETKKAVLEIDKDLAVLKKAIEGLRLPIQVIVVSDHGMKTVDQTVDISGVQSLNGFETTGRGALAAFYSDDSVAIEKAYQDLKRLKGPFQVYKGNNLPPHWQLSDEDRRGDIVVIGDPGVYIGFQSFSPTGVGTSNKATHGWDARETKDLDGLFIASGSLFKKGLKIRAFDNVHVYPLVLHILGLNSEEPHDGDLRQLKPILKTRVQ